MKPEFTLKRAYLRVPIALGFGEPIERMVDAYKVKGTNFCVHRTYKDSRFWTITHRSGLAVTQRAFTRHDAAMLVKEIQPLADWSTHSREELLEAATTGKLDMVAKLIKDSERCW